MRPESLARSTLERTVLLAEDNRKDRENERRGSTGAGAWGLFGSL